MKGAKGNYLGELEELVMLMVGILHPRAYGVGIKKELYSRLGRAMTLSAVHTVLNRLEQKGYLESLFGEATPERGGKRKRYFAITPEGARVLNHVKEVRIELWKHMPRLAFN